MKISISTVHDIGVLKDERVVLKAMQETDLGSYLLVRARLVGHGVSNKLEEIFWFPDRKLKKDELVVLYTKEGSETKSTSTPATYFFYWNLKDTLWNDQDSVPLLMSVEAWDYLDIHPKDIVIKSPIRGELE